MTPITALHLQQLNRRCDYQRLAPLLAAACAGNGIDTPARMRAFVATCCVESAGLTVFVESLNYSAEALAEKFGRHRISLADCQRFGRTAAHAANQNALANILYGGAWGAENLGNTQPGDGWRFRGRGPGQVTGRGHYERVTAAAGLDLIGNPDQLADPAIGFEATARLWVHLDMNTRADAGDPVAIRKAWNGGLNGVGEFRGWLIKAGVIWKG